MGLQVGGELLEDLGLVEIQFSFKGAKRRKKKEKAAAADTELARELAGCHEADFIGPGGGWGHPGGA